MTNETKVLIGALVVTVAIVVGGAFLAGRNSSTGSGAVVDQPERLVRVDDPRTGSADPLVTIVEFGDFECPACAAAHPVIERLREQYADEPVAFVFRQFPLTSIHEHAQLAAEASLAAHAQGKFWEYHDVLFTNQAALERDNLITYAEELGLDVERFTRELDEGVYAEAVSEDQRDGTVLGVPGTPTFFINDRLHAGSVATMQAAIDELLASAGDTQ